MKRTQQTQYPVPLGSVLIAVALIVLAVCVTIVVGPYHNPSPSAAFTIEHSSPLSPLTVAHPITFTANVTGTPVEAIDNLARSGPDNVSLSYQVFIQTPACPGFTTGSLVTVPMLLTAAGGNTYSYTMPASEVYGTSLYYYITASDNYGDSVNTSVYGLSIGGFMWDSNSVNVTVTRTLARQVQLELDAVNTFNETVTISIGNALPAGVQITPVYARVVPTSPVVLEIKSTSDAQLVNDYTVEVDATYVAPSSSAVRIVRTTKLLLTITDFTLDIQPSYLEAVHGNDAAYNLTLSVSHGFTAPNGFRFSVTGLPSGTDWWLRLVSYRIKSDGTTEFAYNLVVKTSSGTTTGLYLLTVQFTATTANGTITHAKSSIQLKVI